MASMELEIRDALLASVVGLLAWLVGDFLIGMQLPLLLRLPVIGLGVLADITALLAFGVAAISVRNVIALARKKGAA